MGLVSSSGQQALNHSSFQPDMLSGWDESHAMLKVFDDEHQL